MDLNFQRIVHQASQSTLARNLTCAFAFACACAYENDGALFTLEKKIKKIKKIP